MTEFLRTIFTPGNFEPHLVHFIPDNMGLVWFIVGGNALITLSYTLIPIALLYLVRKRKDIAFTPIFLLFSAFILLCGLTHLMHIVIFWYPAYWLEAIILALTGVVSILTFFAMLFVLPIALKLKSPREMEEVNAKLAAEIVSRKQAEENLIGNEKIIADNNELLMRALQESDEQKEALMKMNKFMVTRELKMAEMKKELQEAKKDDGNLSS